jgi:hypothetical protein
VEGSGANGHSIKRRKNAIRTSGNSVRAPMCGQCDSMAESFMIAIGGSETHFQDTLQNAFAKQQGLMSKDTYT